MDNNIELPDLILLNDFRGDYHSYIEAVYKIFKLDFVINKTIFRGEELRLKWHPVFQDKAYTFYHITHEGENEENRLPDLRRCERLPWAKPIIENWA